MRHEIDEAVGRLRAERERLGLSLADVEQRSGLRRSALSRLENDKTSNPTLLTLQRFAAAMGLIVHATLSKSPRPNKPLAGDNINTACCMPMCHVGRRIEFAEFLVPRIITLK